MRCVMISLLMVAATALSFALNILSSYQYVRVSAAVLFDMRVALYRHLQSLSPRFWARSKLGDVVSRINSDISEVQRVAADSLLSVLSNVVFLIGSAVIMASLNLRLFLLSIAVVPFSLWALRHYQNKLAGRVKAVRQSSADIGSFLLETLLGIRAVVTAGAEKREVARFRERNNTFLDALLKMQLTSFLSGAVPGTILTLCTAALFLYGGKLVIDGVLTTGSLVALMAYHARLLSPVQNLMSLYTNLVSGGASLARVWELFDTPPEVAERSLTTACSKGGGDVECCQYIRSATTPPMPYSSGFPSVYPQEASARSSDPAARASRLWPIFSSDSTTPSRERFILTVRICGSCGWPICDGR